MKKKATRSTHRAAAKRRRLKAKQAQRTVKLVRVSGWSLPPGRWSGTLRRVTLRRGDAADDEVTS